MEEELRSAKQQITGQLLHLLSGGVGEEMRSRLQRLQEIQVHTRQQLQQLEQLPAPAQQLREQAEQELDYFSEWLPRAEASMQELLPQLEQLHQQHSQAMLEYVARMLDPVLQAQDLEQLQQRTQQLVQDVAATRAQPEQWQQELAGIYGEPAAAWLMQMPQQFPALSVEQGQQAQQHLLRCRQLMVSLREWI